MTAVSSGPRAGTVPPVTAPTGQLRVRHMLGSDAIYRVVGRNARGIEVEVVAVPGLRAGSRFTFRPKDVAAMDVLNG